MMGQVCWLSTCVTTDQTAETWVMRPIQLSSSGHFAAPPSVTRLLGRVHSGSAVGATSPGDSTVGTILSVAGGFDNKLFFNTVIHYIFFRVNRKCCQNHFSVFGKIKWYECWLKKKKKLCWCWNLPEKHVLYCLGNKWLYCNYSTPNCSRSCAGGTIAPPISVWMGEWWQGV